MIQRFTVDPNQYAQEQPYIANNIAMTRLAYDLGDWEDRSYGGDAPLTASAVETDGRPSRTPGCGTTGRCRRPSTRSRRSASTTTSSTSTSIATWSNDATRQVMLSARELAPERNPQAGSWVNQRIVFTHGFGVAMVPVNEVDAQGLPELFIRDMPPVSSAGAPAVSEPRIYFGERPNDWVIVGARQAEFDYPIGTGDGTDGEGQQADDHAGRAPRGSSLDSILTRLLFAARFRDLNLLITDQVTSDQPAADAPEPRRPAAAHRAVPGLRQGPVRGGRPTRAGSSTSRTPTR